jgi:hypothetical protein
MTATETLEITTTAEAFALLDKTLGDLRDVNIANAQEITDVLLDLRILLAKITEEE